MISAASVLPQLVRNETAAILHLHFVALKFDISDSTAVDIINANNNTNAMIESQQSLLTATNANTSYVIENHII